MKTDDDKLVLDGGFDFWYTLYTSSIEPSTGFPSSSLDRGLALLDAFGEFVKPTKVTVSVRCGGTEEEVLAQERGSWIELRTLVDGDGISQSMLETTVREVVSEVGADCYLVQHVGVEDALVRVRLADGDFWIGVDHPRFVSSGSVPPVRPPMRIAYDDEILASSRRTGFQIDTSGTKIWFEESKRGAVNRNRLSDALHRLAEVFPITSIDVDSSSWGTESLEMYFPELVVHPDDPGKHS